MGEDNIATYLQNIGWGNKTFSTKDMKVMLGAGILRFIGGRTTLSYIFGLNEAIKKQENTVLDNALIKVNIFLDYLREEVHETPLKDSTIKRKCELALNMLTD